MCSQLDRVRRRTTLRCSCVIFPPVGGLVLAFGYFGGEIDGKIGPKARESLVHLQTDYGLNSTGTITPESLNALKILVQ
ncbi:peptidoglycan-binding protein [Ancylobacter sp. FA202]|uniref:peptidoglycan-binding domain-containing protein n=1 Tax=Ancylobacter sp. FA202 TaxID=1111106 RepID=UPI00352705FD